jgi:hypothetical protein
MYPNETWGDVTITNPNFKRTQQELLELVATLFPAGMLAS